MTFTAVSRGSTASACKRTSGYVPKSGTVATDKIFNGDIWKFKKKDLLLQAQ
jgi:hypothetical protein